MSGGSYNYLCFQVDEMSDNLRKVDTDPRRAAFQKLLKLVSRAMRDIEWVDSCDSAPGDEHEAIDEVFEFLGSSSGTIKKARAYEALKLRLQEFFDEK